MITQTDGKPSSYLLEPDFPLDPEHLQVFKDFLEDPDETEMYISGEGGTGKTSMLVNYIRALDAHNITYLVGAYTHQACRILREKIYKDPTIDHALTSVRTVHSFLKKSPGINQNATKIQHLQTTNKNGSADLVKVLLFDEYSMIGDDDYMDIGELTTEDDGTVIMKVIYIGDVMQLPPVGSARTIKPRGDYQIMLTKNFRAGAGLQPVLTALREMKLSGNICKLPETTSLVRRVNIVEAYAACEDELNNKVLAYTNSAVDTLNDAIHCLLHDTPPNSDPVNDDLVFIDTHKKIVPFMQYNPFDGPQPTNLEDNSGRLVTPANDTYNTIKYVMDMFDIMLVPSKKDSNKLVLKAYIFGNMAYKNINTLLSTKAVKTNTDIIRLRSISDNEVKSYCASNRDDELVMIRNAAWREYMAFNNNVTLISRPYASTVHKAQGSTFDNVFIDGPDLLLLYKRDPKEYLSLFYTAVSRARHKVYISN